MPTFCRVVDFRAHVSTVRIVGLLLTGANVLTQGGSADGGP
jgi:hypothetical protein